MTDPLLVLMAAALANNIVVIQMVGSDPVLASTHREDFAYGLSCVMLLLLPITTVAATLMTKFILLPLQLQYMRTFMFVLLVIMIVYSLKISLQTWLEVKYPAFFRSDLKIFLPLAGINTTILGSLLLNQEQQHVFHSLFFGLGTAIGFALILGILTAINSRLETADLPIASEGIPITLITLGLLAVALSGFSGLLI